LPAILGPAFLRHVHPPQVFQAADHGQRTAAGKA
jgi:hypothetical protein